MKRPHMKPPGRQLPAALTLICTAATAAAALAFIAQLGAPGLSALLLALAVALYAQEPSRLSVLYLGLAINHLFLLLALWITDGQVSYLGDTGFEAYYAKALWLELCFWIVMAAALGWWRPQLSLMLKPAAKNSARRGGRSYPVAAILAVATGLLALEIVISGGQYFVEYTEASDTGSIAYELGSLMLALAIVLGADRAGRRPSWPAYVLGLGLVLFIALGSGKRLPLAYVVIAVLLPLLQRWGKAAVAALYLGISSAGYAFGILRDAMSLQGIDGVALVAGLEATNQGGVLHASAVYLRIADEGLSTLVDRGIALFSNVFGALLLPLSLLPAQAQVNMHAMQHYPVQGNGGFVASYAYFFLGWAGPVLGALALAWLFSRRGRWVEMVVLILLLSSPRWTLYNVGAAVRLISMAITLLALIEAAPLLWRWLLRPPHSATNTRPTPPTSPKAAP